MKHLNKRLLWLLVIPVICLALVSFKGDNRNFQIAKQLEIFNAVFRELDLFYVDTIDVEKVIGEGVKAMVSGLDPYTIYYPEEEEEDLKMMLTGKYAGVGAIIRYHDKYDRVVIAEPYEGMPALNAGLRAGDVLLSIDGEDLKGVDVSTVSNKLRGEPNTTFSIRVQRPTTGDVIETKITRANIALPPIPYYTLFEDGTGYVILSSFTEKCAREVRMAVIDLKNQGAKHLILDLRGNGGGSMAEAVDIVNMFVPKGVEVVSTKGKIRQATSSFKTKREPLDTEIPLVVLVDGQSASSSEIVAGALQDLDRAVIMGRRTYGKGLVQVVRDLPYNSSLKVTTSKYYTPAGRCVQAIDYARRAEDGSVERIPDSLTNVYRTVGGREVRDGGGITPDVEIKNEKLPNLLYYLANNNVLFDFATDYAHCHPTIAPASEFAISDSTYLAFKEAVKASGFTYDRQSEKALKALKEVASFEGYMKDASAEFEALEKKLNHDLDRDFEYFKDDIKLLLADEIIKRYYYQRGSIIQALKEDTTVAQARKLLADPTAYAAIFAPAIR